MNKTLAYAMMTAGTLSILGAGVITYAGGNASAHSNERQGQGDHQVHMQEKAEALGLDIDQLKADREAGKTFLESAEAQGVTKEQLIEHRKQQIQERLDEAVATGKLTQEEADERAEKMNEHLNSEEFPGQHHRKGSKGHRGFHR